MIITVEGIDGAGKNTLVQALVEHFNATTLAFPRYTESVEAQLVDRALHGKMGDLTHSINGMAILFALDRYGCKDQLMRYAAGGDLAGKVLLLDRYVASNAAYSAARAGDDALADWVGELEFQTLGLPVPDMQILLATPSALAQQRAVSREQQDASRTRDVYETNPSLQENTLAAYMRLADQNWYSPWFSADPATSPEKLAARVAATIGL